MAIYNGKAIVLTGASQGIGRALALALAAQRPRLVLAARDRGRLEEVASGMPGARRGDAGGTHRRLGREASAGRWSRGRSSASAALDVLVNNAGIGMMARFDELHDLAVYERLMKVNYLGCVYPTHHALPHLKKSRGQIVVMASLAGLTGVPTRTGYAASKHACHRLLRLAAHRAQRHGRGRHHRLPLLRALGDPPARGGADGQALGTSPLEEDRIMSAEDCAALTVRAMEQRRRMLVFTLKGKFGRFARLLAPGLVDLIAQRAVRRGR